VPLLENRTSALRTRGLRVVGFSKATKSGGVERVVNFGASKGLTFPLAKDDGEIFEYFNVNGTPSAALVRGGQVLFEGSLSTVTDQVLAGVMDGTLE
jgi:hypothetical protein